MCSQKEYSILEQFPHSDFVEVCNKLLIGLVEDFDPGSVCGSTHSWGECYQSRMDLTKWILLVLPRSMIVEQQFKCWSINQNGTSIYSCCTTKVKVKTQRRTNKCELLWQLTARFEMTAEHAIPWISTTTKGTQVDKLPCPSTV